MMELARRVRRSWAWLVDILSSDCQILATVDLNLVFCVIDSTSML
jgi:hypothetical protein